MADKLQMVPIEKIWFDTRYRIDLGDIDSLAASIKEKGVIQPVTLQTDYKLCAGGRRLEAAKRAGLTKIPALLRDNKGDEVDMREVELIENTFRKDFTWQEQSSLIAELDRLMREKHGGQWSTRKTAELLGHSHPMNVSRALQMQEAMQIPELREEMVKMKTADEAMKLVKRFEEAIVTKELRRRQTKTNNEGMSTMLKIADNSYRVGDALQGLVDTKAKSVQFIEVDPPYGIDLGVQKKKVDATNIVKDYNEVARAEYQAFVEIVAQETYRIAAGDCWMIFWYGPTHHAMIYTALTSAGWKVDEIPAIWTKGGGQTNAPEVHLARAYEPFFVCRKGNPLLHKRGRANVFEFAPATKKYHPTERPLALMAELLDVFLLEAGNITVLIPFLGSGVTLRACYLRGIRGFGWDLSGDYKDKFMLAVEDDTKAILNMEKSKAGEGDDGYEEEDD